MSGHVWQRPAVERHGKNAVAVEDYSGDTFPSFCGGLAYFLTIKVVHIYILCQCLSDIAIDILKSCPGLGCAAAGPDQRAAV